MDGIMLHKIKNELSTDLCPGFITKIHQPAPFLFSFQLRSNRKNFQLFIILEPNSQGVFLSTKSLSNPIKPTAFTMLLRKHLERAILQNIEQPGLERILIFDFNNYKLVVELTGRNRNLVLTKDNNILGAMRYQDANSMRPLFSGLEYTLPPSQGKKEFALNPCELLKSADSTNLPIWKNLFASIEGFGPKSARQVPRLAQIDPEKNTADLTEAEWHSLQEQLLALHDQVFLTKGNPTALYNDDELLEILPFKVPHQDNITLKSYGSFSKLIDDTLFSSWQDNHLLKKKEPLAKVLNQFLKKKIKKSQNLEGDYQSATNFDDFRIKGEILTTYAEQVTRGQNIVSLPNFYADNQLLDIQLDPKLGPHANAQHYFKQYRKKKNALKFIQEQMEIVTQEIIYGEETLHFLNSAETETEIIEIKKELTDAGIVKNEKFSKHLQIPNKHLNFISEENLEILVGRNNTQNDKLVRLAKPNDLWFHVKDMPGSHVILRTAGKTFSEKSLLQAANIAAYYSNGRLASKVAVDYTEVKNVKKPKGGPLGYVTYDKQKTIMATPEIPTDS